MWRKKRKKDLTSTIPLDRLATPTQISSYVKNLINASQYDVHESEAFEVTNVILNQTINHGAVQGTFLNSPNQEIKGGVVLPLSPHIQYIPVVGEHVVVTEYNGQHYYTSIINRKNNPNENSIPGVATSYIPNTKFGNSFERRDIRNIKVNEGDLVFEGRFGNTLKFGSNPKTQSPNIRLRVGQNNLPENRGEPVAEDINKDGSSIYLSTDENIKIDGMMTKRGFLDSPEIHGNSIVINSDQIFMNARTNDINIRSSENVVIEGKEVFIHATSLGTIKLGNPKSFFIPTLRTDVVTDLFKDLIASIQEGFTALTKISTPATIPAAVKDITNIVANRVPNIVDIVANEKYLNKEIMIALPNYKIPKTNKSNKTSKTLLDGVDQNSVGSSGLGSDGNFNSDNFERPSNRTEDGSRDTGPRRY